MSSKQKINAGTYIMHLSSRNEGRVIGTTRMKVKFENKEDVFEYRVQTVSEGIKIWSPSNFKVLDLDASEPSQLIQDGKKVRPGKLGEYLTYRELKWRKYKAVMMPEGNKGFDIQCHSPSNIPFVVEAKSSSSNGTQAPLQLDHLQGELRGDRFYVFVKYIDGNLEEFVVMSNEEVHAAWTLMPKRTPTGEPYVIDGRGHIDWKHLTPHRERWDKLPK